MRMYLYLLLGFAFLQACHSKKEEPPIVLRPVQTASATSLGSINKSFVGSVQATKFSELAFKIGGIIETFTITEGESLKKGQLIAALDDKDYKLTLQSAKARYTAAKQVYDRMEGLYKNNAIAKQALEKAEADYIQAQSQLEFAQNRMNDTRLLTPFDGFIEQKYVQNNEVVGIGQKIVKFVDPNTIEIKFIFPEGSIDLLELPMKIYVEFETIKKEQFIAQIKENVYSSQGTGIPITLCVTDNTYEKYKNDVFPGFSCIIQIKFEDNLADSFVLPLSALFEKDGVMFVWTIDKQNSTVKKTPIIAILTSTNAYVTSGLNTNDLIVTAGVNELHENEKVNYQ